MTTKVFKTLEEAEAYAEKNWYLDKTIFTKTKEDNIKAEYKNE